jgi:hypothetical protein
MTGEYLISIQEPDDKTDWFILKTDKDTYDFRLGGLVKTSAISTGNKVKLPFDKAKIVRALTDNFAVYIELDNGYCIVHSDTFINSDGKTDFEVYFYDNQWYINDGGLEGMTTIKSFI